MEKVARAPRNEPCFSSQIDKENIRVSLLSPKPLLGARHPLPFAQWREVLPEKLGPIYALLQKQLEDGKTTEYGDYLALPLSVLPDLSDGQAEALGLPSAVPYAFQLKTCGGINQDTYHITTSWVSGGGIPRYPIREGALLREGEHLYRIPKTIYDIVCASESLQKGNTLSFDDRMRALAHLRQLLPHDGSDHTIDMDLPLKSIRVYHASSFSLHIPTEGESFRFHPVLFGQREIEKTREDGAQLNEAQNILPQVLQDVFTKKRFARWTDVRSCYALENGAYVYLDPELKSALGVVRKLQDADQQTRRDFIRSPQRFLRDSLGETIDEDVVERLFVETEQYAKNVVGLGLWSPPVTPWMTPKPNSWLPEKFGLKIGDVQVKIAPQDIRSLYTKIKEGLETGGVSLLPIPYPDGEVTADIPQTEQTLSALEGILPFAPDEGKEFVAPEKGAEEKAKNGIAYFLIVEDNIHEKGYTANVRRRLPPESPVLQQEPATLKTTFKSHQNEGFRWLVQSWAQGAPGVLLADDMGVGKTLQALAFLAWIRERKREGAIGCQGPMLIVAPSALLRNWKVEIEKHLYEPHLGTIGEAFRSGLSAFKQIKGKDIKLAQSVLNRDKLRENDVILTTYETYRDYHHSFGGIRFSAVVLDECQKIKTPDSQVRNAFVSMNAEFVIAMTGTPVENRIEDLWSIIDRVWQGFFGSLKDFSAEYASANADTLKSLTTRLKTAASPDVSEPIMLRRMKDEILEGLPTKKIIHYPQHMPPQQAEAYEAIVQKALRRETGSMLETIHSFRGTSLHPVSPDRILKGELSIGYRDYIAQSGRMIETFRILEEIREKKEKALIFIEFINMQTLVAQMIYDIFRLPSLPFIINGNTGQKTQSYVDRFQEGKAKDFDVMILSPKVGGVGITLTAANHVIHLSRWWNPAVEDQSTDRVYRIGQDKPVSVYIPQAIHPDPNLSATSFDLKLDALLERKRTLSRDMLCAPVDDQEDCTALYYGILPEMQEETEKLSA